MPTEILIVLLFLTCLISIGMFAGIKAFLLEYREEQRHPVPAWDATATQELHLWRREQQREQERCPGCQGTRCWDWRREGRSCKENPTTASPDPDPLKQGRHHVFTLRPVPSGWWPIPRTRMARLNPHLWAKVADHCQIPVVYPRVVALP